MAKRKAGINIEDLMRKLIESFGSVDKKELNAWIDSEYQALGLDMTSKHHKTKMATARKKYTEESYPHYQLAKKVKKYTLRITLKGIRPSIWRKVEVPSNITLRHLAELIIPLMGWSGCHLHQFRKGDDLYVPAYQSDVNDTYGFYGSRQHASEEFVIADILREKGKTVLFDYDFGDDWRHEVRLSSVNDYAAEEPRRIKFIGGKRACPPEDCGGIWGYEEFCKDEPSTEDASGQYWDLCSKGVIDPVYSHASLFDPEEFDAEEAVQLCEDFNE